MNYKLLILILFVFLIYSLQSTKKISATSEEVSDKIQLYVSKLDVAVSILLNDSTCDSSSKYCVGDVVNVTSKLINVGNLNATGNLLSRILNRTNEIHNKTWSNVNITVGEIKYYNTIYKLQNSDVDHSLIGSEFFTTNSNYSYDGKSNESSCIFEVKKGIGTLQRFPDKISDTIPPGRSKTYSSGIRLLLYKACNSTNVTLNKTQGIPGDWVSFSQDNLYLLPDDLTSTDINITIPPLTPEGVYDNGTIFAYADGQRVDIGLKITVAMTDFILNITTQEKRVCPGKTVPSSINITKILPSEDVNVNMTYQILDFNHTVYDENKDNLLLSNTSIQKLYTLTVPSSAKEGFYMLLVTLDYNSTLIQAYDTFEVISCKPLIQPAGPSAGNQEQIIPQLTAPAIELNLSADILTVITGNKTSFTAAVKNIGTESVKSIKISIENVPSDWIRIFPTTVDIDVDKLEQFLIIVDVPTNATPGIYKMKVKATDDVESNTVILTLIVGRDPKEVAELLLKELESIRAEAKKSLLIEDCIDTTIMKTFYQDAELAFEKGMKDYDSKNYEGAINWFEYALPVEKNVVNKVDITLELEIEATNSSKFLIPPFLKSEQQMQLAGTYLQEKNYEKICDPLEKIRKFILIGLIFWPGIVILFIILIILIIIFRKRSKEKERVKIMERVRERLKT
jgi:hypothetical protein